MKNSDNLKNEGQQEFDLLRKIASRLPGVVYQYRLRPDGSSCFPYASDAIRDLYRVTPEEVPEDASGAFAAGHPDDVAGVVASILKSAKEMTPWQHEFRVKYSDGILRLLYGDAVPEREEDGSVLWTGFITDITERKQAEHDLKQLANRLKLATHAGSVSISYHMLSARIKKRHLMPDAVIFCQNLSAGRSCRKN
jgi:PAS domain S-box-containing protein